MQAAKISHVRSVAVPLIMYGTAWKEDRTQALVLEAIATGFRAFDTANQRKHYVEEEVGAAVRSAIGSGTVTQSNLFLQTKFTYQRGQDHRLPYDPDCDLTTQVRQSIASSLEHLGVTRIDSYILHGPSRSSGLGQADWQTWRAMEDAVDGGLVGLLGISNVSADQLDTLLDGVRIRPAFVQNRCLARASWDAEMRAICQTHDFIYQAFSLLSGNRQVVSDRLRWRAELFEVVDGHDEAGSGAVRGSPLRPRSHHPMRTLVSSVQTQSARPRGDDGRARPVDGAYDDHALVAAVRPGVRDTLAP